MRLVAIAVILLLMGCSSPSNTELKSGVWRGVIDVQGNELPFNFDVFKDSTGKLNINIINAREKLLLDEVSFANDSITINLHIFDSQLKAKVENDSLKGFFIKNYEKNYKLPFKAAYNQSFRFNTSHNEIKPDYTGKYAVKFIHESDTSNAVGIFKQTDTALEGTFLNPSGDYRYLQGSLVNGKMNLSAFDGNHAYLFTAEKINDSTLNGDFWSGKLRHDHWIAVKDEDASLPDPESLTFLKKGYDKIEFSFPDLDKKMMSLSDEKYKGKIVILQLFGSWCPNCMDETKFLAPWYDKNKNRGIEIIAMAYEAKPDFNYASSRVKKMKEKLKVNYDFVIAGVKDNAEASKTLPMLNGITAFPTIVFIGKDGKVKKIHTGFSGPGTGIYYEEFIEYFNKTVNELVGS